MAELNLFYAPLPPGCLLNGTRSLPLGPCKIQNKTYRAISSLIPSTFGIRAALQSWQLFTQPQFLHRTIIQRRHVQTRSYWVVLVFFCTWQFSIWVGRSNKHPFKVVWQNVVINSSKVQALVGISEDFGLIYRVRIEYNMKWVFTCSWLSTCHRSGGCYGSEIFPKAKRLNETTIFIYHKTIWYANVVWAHVNGEVTHEAIWDHMAPRRLV